MFVGRLAVAVPLASVPATKSTILHVYCEEFGAQNINKSYPLFEVIVNPVDALVAAVQRVRNEIAPLSAASTQNHTVLLSADGSAETTPVQECMPAKNLPPFVHTSKPHLA